uniref:Uncharacterized protein n=1 Tax=Magnetospirillum gryphiswaldense TaxID=55518 RepID=Q3BK87_9PROT|nr:hypothetical protein mgI527 [Magnetospirillum gryphiswaldense MSR-1]
MLRFASGFFPTRPRGARVMGVSRRRTLRAVASSSRLLPTRPAKDFHLQSSAHARHTFSGVRQTPWPGQLAQPSALPLQRLWGDVLAADVAVGLMVGKETNAFQSVDDHIADAGFEIIESADAVFVLQLFLPARTSTRQTSWLIWGSAPQHVPGLRGRDDGDGEFLCQGQQIAVAGHQRVGTPGDCQFQKRMIEGIAALGDGRRRIGDDDRFAPGQVIGQDGLAFVFA